MWNVQISLGIFSWNYVGRGGGGSADGTVRYHRVSEDLCSRIWLLG